MSISKYLYIIFEILMELELKLEWLEAVSKHLGGGQAPQICLTLPQAIPTSIPIPLKCQKIGMKFGANIGAEIVAKFSEIAEN